MSVEAVGARVPEWDVADRMRKALRVADVGVQEMAGYLGVSRNAVGNWINGHTPPSVQTTRLWALRTGVSYQWLSTGKDDDNGPRPTASDEGREECAAWDSNPEPTGSGRQTTLGDVVPLQPRRRGVERRGPGERELVPAAVAA